MLSFRPAFLKQPTLLHKFVAECHKATLNFIYNHAAPRHIRIHSALRSACSLFYYICDMGNGKVLKEVMFAEVGKYCLDISKLVFGGVILAGIMKLYVNLLALIIVGVVVVIVLTVLGLWCIYESNKKES